MGKIASNMRNQQLPLGGSQTGRWACAAMYRLTLKSRHQSTDAVRLSSAANGQPALLLESPLNSCPSTPVIADIISKPGSRDAQVPDPPQTGM